MSKLIATKALEIAKKEMLDGGNKKEIWGSNNGPQVLKYLESVGIGYAEQWCMAFVYYCINRACQFYGVKNPLPKTGYVPDIARWGKRNGIYYEVSFATGDMFFIMDDHPTDPWKHVGFITGIINDTTVSTIEGNTNNNGSANGDGIYERTRKIYNMSWVAWQNLIQDVVQEKGIKIVYNDVILTTATILSDGVSYVPVRELSEGLGYKVDFQKENNRILLTKEVNENG